MAGVMGVLLAVVALWPAGAVADITKANTTQMNRTTDWSPATLPNSTTLGIFDNTISAANANALVLGGNGDVPFLGLKFNNNLNGPVKISWNSSSESLSLYGSGIDMSAANQNVSILCNYTLLAADQTWNVGTSCVLTNYRLGGTGALIKAGAGTLVCSTAGTNTGTKTINTGKVTLLAGWGTNSITIGSSGTLEIGAGAGGSFRPIANTVALAGSLVNSDTVNYMTVTSSNITLDAAGGSLGGAGEIRFSGVLGAGSGPLTKIGAGLLNMSGNNTNFTGNIVVSAGTLYANNANALGDTAHGTTINAGGTLDMYSQTIGAEPVTINGGTLQGGNGTTFSGAITIGAGGGTVLDYGSSGMGLTGGVGGTGDLTISNNISAAADRSITFSGASINSTGQVINAGVGAHNPVVLSVAIGTNVTGLIQNSASSQLSVSGWNSTTGQTTVLNGTIQLTAGGMPDAGQIMVHTNGVMDFNSINDTVGGLAGAGLVKLGTAFVTNALGISPGTNLVTVGTLTATGTTGRVVLGANSTNLFHLIAPGNADQVVIYGNANTTNLTQGGVLKIAAASAKIQDGTYTLFHMINGKPAGSFSSLLMPGGYNGTLATNVAGNVTDIVLTSTRKIIGTSVYFR